MSPDFPAIFQFESLCGEIGGSSYSGQMSLCCAPQNVLWHKSLTLKSVNDYRILVEGPLAKCR